MHNVIARNGSARSAKSASGDAPNTTTSSSMSCISCARRCGKISWLEPEAQGVETAAPDSGDRSDPGSRFDRGDANAAPLPHQTTAVEVQRPGVGNALQRTIPRCGRGAATFQETGDCLWPK